MQVSELGNLGLGAGIPDDVKARAEAQWSALEARTSPDASAGTAMRTALMRARPVSTQQAMRVMDFVTPVVNTKTAPQTASQAAAVNANARGEKQRAQFVEDLRKINDNTLMDMLKAYAQKTKVGNVEYAQVINYGVEIADELQRRFGAEKTKQLMAEAHKTSPKAAATAKPEASVKTSTVTDPFKKSEATATDVEPERGMTINTAAEERSMGSFFQKYGIALGVGAAALVGVGWFLLRQKRATAPALP